MVGFFFAVFELGVSCIDFQDLSESSQLESVDESESAFSEVSSFEAVE